MKAEGSVVFWVMILASVAYSIYESIRNAKRKTDKNRRGSKTEGFPTMDVYPETTTKKPEERPATKPDESADETFMRRLEELLNGPVEPVRHTPSKPAATPAAPAEPTQKVEVRPSRNATNKTSKKSDSSNDDRVEFDLRQAVIHSEILKPKFRDEEL